MSELIWYLIQKIIWNYYNCLLILKFKYILYRQKCIVWISLEIIFPCNMPLWHVSINYYIYLGSGVQAEK